MIAAQLRALLIRIGAAQEIVSWANEKSLTEFWRECERPEWMLWLSEQMVSETKWPPREEVARTACACAETTLHFLERKHPKIVLPRTTLAMARAYAEGRIPAGQLRRALDDCRLLLNCGRLGLSANNVVVAAHDAAAAFLPTFEGSAANAVTAAIAAESWPLWFRRQAVRRKFADIVRRELKIPLVAESETLSEPPASSARIPNELTRVGPQSSEKLTAADGNDVLQAARQIHDGLTRWSRMLFAQFEQRGIAQQEAGLQMSALFGKLEGVAKQIPPAIASATMLSLLTQYLQYLTTEEGGLNNITAELATGILVPLMRLQDRLDSVLCEEGWAREQIASQVSALSEKIMGVTKASPPGIAPLTLAFAVDNYVKLLITGIVVPASSEENQSADIWVSHKQHESKKRASAPPTDGPAGMGFYFEEGPDGKLYVPSSTNRDRGQGALVSVVALAAALGIPADSVYMVLGSRRGQITQAEADSVVRFHRKLMAEGEAAHLRIKTRSAVEGLTEARYQNTDLKVSSSEIATRATQIFREEFGKLGVFSAEELERQGHELGQCIDQAYRVPLTLQAAEELLANIRSECELRVQRLGTAVVDPGIAPDNDGE
jgi:hypothetical protein